MTASALLGRNGFGAEAPEVFSRSLLANEPRVDPSGDFLGNCDFNHGF